MAGKAPVGGAVGGFASMTAMADTSSATVSVPRDLDAGTDTPDPVALTTDDRDLVEDELLVEEISIDGMCGVY